MVKRDLLDDLKNGSRVLPVQRFREADHRAFMTQIKDVTGQSLDEFAGEVGQLQYIAADEQGRIRMIMSAINILNEYGISAHFAGFDGHRNPTVWLDADVGDFTAGRGAVRLNRNGIEVPDAGDAITLSDSLWLLHAHMYMSNGYFVLANYRVANEWNEILNGDFETGDLTNWTETDPSGKISVVAYEEGYKCSFADTAMATENIKQSVAAPSGCIITFKAKSTNNCVVTIRDTMATNIESLYTYPEWRNYVVIFDDPCTEFYIGFDCAGEQGDIDDVVVKLKTGPQTVSRIRFGPNGGTENFGSLEVNPSSRTDGFFRVRSSAADAGPGSPSYLFYVNPVAGKIGIRKQNPAYELDMEGDLNISGDFRKNGVVIGSGGGLTYNTVTVTTGNVSPTEENHYDCTIGGMTADRDFNLPTPSAAGKRVALRILDGDDTYELIIKANGTEITRLFIAGETLELMSTGTGAGDWKISADGRIPCIGRLTRTSSHANTTHAANTQIKPDWNTAEMDQGNVCDTTNDRFNIRRAGKYEIDGSFAPAAAVGDQEFMSVHIHKNPAATPAFDTVVISGGLRQSYATTSAITLAGAFPAPVDCAAGDVIAYYFRTQVANVGLKRTDSNDGSQGQSFFAIKEIL